MPCRLAICRCLMVEDAIVNMDYSNLTYVTAVLAEETTSLPVMRCDLHSIFAWHCGTSLKIRLIIYNASRI